MNREALRVLRRLCEKGAVLAVASEMDKAVVVRETEAGQNRTAVVDRDVAEAMALKCWISCDTPGRVSRYAITSAGRSALGQLMARAENSAQGFAESQAAFLGQDAPLPEDDAAEGRRRLRHGIGESPDPARAAATATAAAFSRPTWCGPANACAKISRWATWATRPGRTGPTF